MRIVEWISGWLGLAPHFDEKIGVPHGWRVTRGVVAVFAAFVATYWPDIKEATWRFIAAIASVGGVAWAFNLFFYLAWRPQYERVQRMQRILIEAANVADTPLATQDIATAANAQWQVYKVRSLLGDAFKHHIGRDYDDFMKHEREKAEAVGHHFPNGALTAQYLRQLANALKVSDFDDRFLTPKTFKQYADAGTWPTNPAS